MFLFTFLLYHILSHLSRGFLDFFWLSLRLVPNTASGLVHICIPHNGATVRSRTLSSWSNTTLVGLVSTTSAMLPSFVPLLYHTLRGLSRGFLHFFSTNPTEGTHPQEMRSYLTWLSSLHPYCITTWGICQGVSWSFFQESCVPEGWVVHSLCQQFDA